MLREQSIKVWDSFVRVFHWALVLFFIIAYATGEEESLVHVWSGYAIAALLALRVVWGLVGSRHARFSDFIYRPSEIKAYARSLLNGSAKRYLGHNPLGGLMVVALLLSLAMTSLSGMMLYGAEEGKGPLAGMMQAQAGKSLQLPSVISTAQADDDDEREGKGGFAGKKESEALEEVHEFFANFTVLLIVFHLFGVMFESLFHRESLISAMLSGFKRTGER